MNTDNVKHGIITDCTTLVGEATLHGITVSTDCSDPNISAGFSSLDPGPEHWGVKITFDTPFTDLPSVIATPYVPLDDGCPLPSIVIPRCLVENITKKSVIVKCGMIYDQGAGASVSYQPMPFTFVAVGQ